MKPHEITWSDRKCKKSKFISEMIAKSTPAPRTTDDVHVTVYTNFRTMCRDVRHLFKAGAGWAYLDVRNEAFWGGKVDKKAVREDIKEGEDYLENFFAEASKDPYFVVIEGVGYHFENRMFPRTDLMGFGGTKMTCRKLDGTDIRVCNNVWCRGDIPVFLRHLYPDSHEFVLSHQHK